MTNLEYFKNHYKITDDIVNSRALMDNDNSRRTATKELIGESYIKEFNIWERLFPSYRSIERITSEKLQREGIDYIINNDTFVDIKCDIGPDYANHIPIELTQYGEFTNTFDKKTDYIVHIIIDDFKERVVMINYKWVRRYCEKVMKDLESNTPTVAIYNSSNGTGKYTMVDYINGMPVEEKFKADLKVIEIRKKLFNPCDLNHNTLGGR